MESGDSFVCCGKQQGGGVFVTCDASTIVNVEGLSSIDVHTCYEYTKSQRVDHVAKSSSKFNSSVRLENVQYQPVQWHKHTKHAILVNRGYSNVFVEYGFYFIE